MECFNRTGKLKRVHQCHGAIELILGCGIARSGEVHAAQLLRRGGVICLGETHRRPQERQNDNEQDDESSHRGSFQPQYANDSLADDSPVTEIAGAILELVILEVGFRLRSDNSDRRLLGGKGSQAGSLNR
jgi:hypothetical protein